LSEILPSSGLGLGTDEVGQKDLNNFNGNQGVGQVFASP